MSVLRHAIKLKPLDPFLLPQQQVDCGAIRFVLSGANIMCPGMEMEGIATEG